MLDLTAIKARRNTYTKDYAADLKYPQLEKIIVAAGIDIDALLLEVEHLREQNKQLGEALREYNDAELYYAHKNED